ncbi:MAG: hypothetical protein IJZ46_05745 [Bacilli bacterium]|nr:hypothetical protein [Bacilli bacterium]
MEIIEVKQDILSETEELLFSAQDIDVVIDYYWDSHGRNIDWKGPNDNHRDEIHADTVKITEYTKTVSTFGSEPYEMCTWRLYINNEKIKILDIDSYNKRKKLFITAIMGQG